MAVVELPAMKTSPKFVFFTDFDGTITLQDSNDWLTDSIGYGVAKRKQANQDCLNGTTTFRECFNDMMESVTTPFSRCKELLVENIVLDRHFTDFFHYARSQNIPIVVLSSGMGPIIRALLEKLLGPTDASHIEIISNNVTTRPGKTLDDEDGWDVVFHDDSDFGHDKSLTLRLYSALPEGKRPVMFYAGDGVSDLSAARETDLLFAKKGKDLVTYCAREEVPFSLFEDWSSITETVKQIVDGKTTVQHAAKEGYEQFKSGQAVVNGLASGSANGMANGSTGTKTVK